MALLCGWKLLDSRRVFDLGDSIDHASVHLTYCLKRDIGHLFFQGLLAHFQLISHTDNAPFIGLAQQTDRLWLVPRTIYPYSLHNMIDTKTFDICGYEISLLSHSEMWMPCSAVEMMTFLKEANHLGGLGDLRVLDMGTGSGVVGILCGLMGAGTITLSDYNRFFVEQASKNARLNDLSVRSIVGDRFGAFQEGQDEYDLIISNPPVQPWLHTDINRTMERAGAADWNEAGENGRMVLDALIEESDKYLSVNSALITSCSTRHGHRQTIRLMEKHWKGNWETIYAAEHACDPDYHGPYMPTWRAMQAEDGDLRIYRIDTRQRRFAPWTDPDGTPVLLATDKVKGKKIPVWFIRTARGWRITDTEGNTLREVGKHHPDVPGPAIDDRWYYTYYLIRARKRRETDALGTLSISTDVYYGIHTERARRNFAISRETIGHWRPYIASLAKVKKAAALANADIGTIPQPVSEAICAAADEVVAGKIEARHFPICMIQGGGGTSTNMNLNEVLANRASEILTGRKGYDAIHPNDHVNYGQSTSDVIVTGLNLALHLELIDLIVALQILEAVLESKMANTKGVVKVSRTCLKDAVPITLGQEFSAYLAAIQRSIRLLKQYAYECLDVPLGGTVVGTSLGVNAEYLERLYPHLAKVTGLAVRRNTNFFDVLQNGDQFIQISGALKSTAALLSKMATDLRILSSGNGEMILPAVQAGSSFMPGKVNPVLPELINQVAYLVYGNDVTVAMAVEAGELNLNVWSAIIAKSLFESCRTMAEAVPIFARRCIDGIVIDEALCRKNAENSLSNSSVIAMVFGYKAGAKVARLAEEQGISIREAAVRLAILPDSLADELLDPMTLTDVAKSAEAIRRVMAWRKSKSEE
uniref:Aspartate ammonia-lyase n=1 Tax=Candidatus Kentrum sp. LFY TaxID=2126342 RepID=A0A450V2H0_9GAMM|nr:MAG: Aspartate ammonia-lyase [Candidatus Kentron sp. LFY]